MRPELEWLNFLIIAVPSAILPWVTMKLTQKKNKSDTWEGLYRAMREERDLYKNQCQELEERLKEKDGK